MSEDALTKSVRVGTSGYSFADWKGRFYPNGIDKGKMLDYYATKFETVEINSTYYGIPHPAVFFNMLKKVPDNFDFMVKVPQALTHRRIDITADRDKFINAIAPLTEAERLAGLLAQFPYSFKFSQAALDYVAFCRDAVAPNRLFVEFRHNSWVNRQMYDRLRVEEIGYVCVDEPKLSGLLDPDYFNTTDTGYIRLHGRNAEQWWDGGALRYDYLYSDEELKEWRKRVKKISAKVKKQYVFFNNCHEGKAAENANKFIEMIGSEEPNKQ